MTDALADIFSCCGLCAYSACESWCILHPFGTDAHCCGGPRGCCGSCCDSSFNEDNFDERLQGEQAKNGANPAPVDSQPVPLHDMSTSPGDPKPTDDEPKEV